MSKIEGLKEQARRHEQKEEWRKALELYQRAIDHLAEEDDPDIGLHNRVGDLYIRVGEIDSAVRALEQAVELYVESELPNNAIAVCKKILRNVPDRQEVFLRMGQIRAGQGFLVDARSHFLTYAERMQQAGQLDQALRALVEFADAAPEDTEIRLAIAGHFEQHDRIDEAVEQLGQGYASALRQGQDQAADVFRARLEELRPGVDVAAFVAAEASDEEEFVVEATALDGADAVMSGEDGAATDWGSPPEAEWADPTEDSIAFGETDDIELISDLDESSDVMAAALEDAGDGLLEVGLAADPAEVEEASGEIDDALYDPFAATSAEGSLGEAIDAIGPDVSHLDPPSDDANPLEGLHVVQDDDLEFVVVEDEFDEDAPLPLTTFHDAEGDDFGAPDDAVADDPFDVSIEGPAELPLALPAEPDLEATLAPPVTPAAEGFLSGMDDDDDDVSSSMEAALEESSDSGVADDLGVFGEPVEPVDEAARDAGVEDVVAGEDVDSYEDVRRDADDVEPVSDAVADAGEEPDELERLQRRVETAHRSGDDAALADAYVGLGDALRRSGEEVRAVAVFREALQVMPDHPGARAGLDAGPSVERKVTEVASNEDYVDLGALILGDSDEKTTRFVVAYEEPSGDEQADFAKMLSQFKAKVAENVDASDVKAHHDLGTAYKEMGLLDEAVEEFQAALRASADHLPTYEMLGQTFLDKGASDTAVRVLTRALDAPYEVEDELLGIYYYLGRAHERSGNKEQALEFYERVFSLDINFADVTERLRALR